MKEKSYMVNKKVFFLSEIISLKVDFDDIISKLQMEFSREYFEDDFAIEIFKDIEVPISIDSIKMVLATNFKMIISGEIQKSDFHDIQKLILEEERMSEVSSPDHVGLNFSNLFFKLSDSEIEIFHSEISILESYGISFELSVEDSLPSTPVTKPRKGSDFSIDDFDEAQLSSPYAHYYSNKEAGETKEDVAPRSFKDFDSRSSYFEACMLGAEFDFHDTGK